MKIAISNNELFISLRRHNLTEVKLTCAAIKAALEQAKREKLAQVTVDAGSEVGFTMHLCNHLGFSKCRLNNRAVARIAF